MQLWSTRIGTICLAMETVMEETDFALKMVKTFKFSIIEVEIDEKGMNFVYKGTSPYFPEITDRRNIPDYQIKHIASLDTTSKKWTERWKLYDADGKEVITLLENEHGDSNYSVADNLNMFGDNPPLESIMEDKGRCVVVLEISEELYRYVGFIHKFFSTMEVVPVLTEYDVFGNVFNVSVMGQWLPICPYGGRRPQYQLIVSVSSTDVVEYNCSFRCLNCKEMPDYDDVLSDTGVLIKMTKQEENEYYKNG